MVYGNARLMNALIEILVLYFGTARMAVKAAEVSHLPTFRPVDSNSNIMGNDHYRTIRTQSTNQMRILGNTAYKR